MKDTLVILGSHPRGKETFDFSRTDCDIWVFNEALAVQEHIKRADAVFQMHLEPIWRNPNNRNDPKHYEWLSSGKTPIIYMQDVYRDVPMSERYPLDEIKRDLLHSFEWTSRKATGNHYFSSTFCYALALGIYKRYKTIECHGVEMETDTEYRYQRDGVTFWIGLALGMGIQVKAFCNIFDFPLYGYEGEATLTVDDFERRIQELTPLIEAKKEEYKLALERGSQAFHTFLNYFKDADELRNTLIEQVKIGFELNVLGGQLAENERYKAKAIAMTDAAGAFAFSRQEFEAAMQGHGQKANAHKSYADAASGAVDAVYQKVIKEKNATRRRGLMREFGEKGAKYITESLTLGVHHGAALENRDFLMRLDNLVKAAGGAKSEAVLLERMNVEVPA